MELEYKLNVRIELVFCSVHFLSNFDIVVVKSFLVAVMVVTELRSSIGLYVDCFLNVVLKYLIYNWILCKNIYKKLPKKENY